MLYLVDVFDKGVLPELETAQVYADKINIQKLMAMGFSLCINYGSDFLDVVSGEYMNPTPEWFK